MRGVEPEDVRIILRDQFAQLRDRLAVDIATGFGQELGELEPPVGAMEQAIATGILVIPVIARGIGLAPVEGVRIIEPEADLLPFARGAQFDHRIAMPGRGFDQVVVVDL